jgi:hypothetical protein
LEQRNSIGYATPGRGNNGLGLRAVSSGGSLNSEEKKKTKFLASMEPTTHPEDRSVIIQIKMNQFSGQELHTALALSTAAESVPPRGKCFSN